MIVLRPPSLPALPALFIDLGGGVVVVVWRVCCLHVFSIYQTIAVGCVGSLFLVWVCIVTAEHAVGVSAMLLCLSLLCCCVSSYYNMTRKQPLNIYK